MKIRVQYFDEVNDKLIEFDGTQEFDFTEWEDAVAVVQEVVDKYEARGITIDQGGDDDWYELDLPDGQPDDPNLTTQLLADVETALKNENLF